MDSFEGMPFTDAFERTAYAVETERMCRELYDYIPFRPFKWHKLYKEIKKRNKLVNDSLDRDNNWFIESYLAK